MLIKKYIRGVEGRGEEVINALRDLGGVNVYQFDGESPWDIYTIKENGCISSENEESYTSKIILEYFEEITLPEKEKVTWSPFNLQPFDRILVRDDNKSTWGINLFSGVVIIDGKKYVAGIGHIPYIQSVPYNEETECLLGEKDTAPDFYQWWEDEVC